MSNSSYYTKERLVATVRFYLAQSFSDDLLEAGVITSEEYELLSEINFKTFEPLFSEIRPKSLDK